MRFPDTAPGFLFCFTFVFAGAAPAADRAPRFALIATDDLGWRDFSVDGSEFYETLNLVRQGTLFTNAHALAPGCSPTHASLLTGQFPARREITAPCAPQRGEAIEPSPGACALPDQPAIPVAQANRLSLKSIAPCFLPARRKRLTISASTPAEAPARSVSAGYSFAAA